MMNDDALMLVSDDQVEDDVKQERFDALMSMQQGISQSKHQKMIGKTFDVIVEGYSEETDLLLQGRTSLQAPDIDGVVLINAGEAQKGDIVKVTMTDAHDYDLVGEIV